MQANITPEAEASQLKVLVFVRSSAWVMIILAVFLLFRDGIAIFSLLNWRLFTESISFPSEFSYRQKDMDMSRVLIIGFYLRSMLALLILPIGVGLLYRKNWARIAYLVLCVMLFVGLCLGLLVYYGELLEVIQDKMSMIYGLEEEKSTVYGRMELISETVKVVLIGNATLITLLIWLMVRVAVRFTRSEVRAVFHESVTVAYPAGDIKDEQTKTP